MFAFGKSLTENTALCITMKKSWKNSDVPGSLVGTNKKRSTDDRTPLFHYPKTDALVTRRTSREEHRENIPLHFVCFYRSDEGEVSSSAHHIQTIRNRKDRKGKSKDTEDDYSHR